MCCCKCVVVLTVLVVVQSRLSQYTLNCALHEHPFSFVCNNDLDTPENAYVGCTRFMYRFRHNERNPVGKTQRKTNPIKWICDMNECKVSSERGGRKVRGHESPSVIAIKDFCRIHHQQGRPCAKHILRDGCAA